MANDPRTIAVLLDQLADLGVTARPMFGEHGLYCDGRLVALVCDDRLLVKPTAAGRALVPDCPEDAPYPGAKPCLLIDPGDWDDRDALQALIRVTAAELPLPKPRKKPKPPTG